MTSNYEALVKKYACVDCIEYDNPDNENLNMLQKKEKSVNGFHKVILPVVIISDLSSVSKLVIKDNPSDMFELPDIIKEHYEDIFTAHNTSTIYNQLNIRVTDWLVEDNCFTIYTSRTTYYNSLVTNRAMDLDGMI